ncbi:MAG: glycosyltransferase family 2 protein [Verrucomicrobiales bacterium]|nr:glycosyltransferase family 2 protein [Verrucomicrobiales bacterium]
MSGQFHTSCLPTGPVDLSRVAVVIPYYHGKDFIQSCLRSILANGIRASRIYIVENSVRRGELASLAVEFPEVHVLEAPPRLGFGKACNLGARTAISDGAVMVAILNQDLVVGDQCLTRLVRSLYADPRLAITAPLNFSHDFREMEGFYVKHYLSECPSLVKDAIEGNLRTTYAVPKVMGSSFVVRADVVERLGLFDEIYFMYCEDDDLCRRYIAAGLGLALVSDAAVGHAHSHTNQDRDESIDVQERESRQVFLLKSSERSFLQNWIRVQRFNFLDYFKLVSSLRVGLLFSALGSDLRVLAKTSRIRTLRRREMELTAAYRQEASVQRPRGIEKVA